MKKLRNLFFCCYIFFFNCILRAQCPVVINEIFYSPDQQTANSMHDLFNTATTAEWVELYNPSSCTSVDISCWILGSDETNTATGGSNFGAFVFPSGTVIPPLGFIVLGGAAASPKDFDVQNSSNYCGNSRWFLSNTAGWIALYTNTGTVVDAVYWSNTGAGLSSSPSFSYALNSSHSVSCACPGSSINSTIASNIPGIEFAGTSTGLLGEGWKRTVDGGSTWATETPAQSTPKACNGACAQPLTVVANGTNISCSAPGSATATASNGTPPYTYSWSPSGGTGATANNLTAGSYVVSITDACNCVKTATVSIANNGGQAVINLSGTSICYGNTATLTASGASTYTWTPGGQSGSSITVNPLSTTVYNVNGTDANGCSGTATATVTVNPLPVVTAIGSTICAGSSDTLTASGAVSYTWQPGNIGGASIVVGPITSLTYTVSGTDANGCSDTATATMVVNALPVVTASGGTVCPGDSLQLNASGASTYNWSPSPDLSNTGIPNPYASPTISSTYTVTGTSSAGCVNTATATVNIVNNINATVSPNATICNGNTTVLTAGGGSNYQWSPATGLSNPVIANPVASPTATTVYHVVVSSGSCIDSTTVTITVNPVPVVTANSDTICMGNSTQLIANGANSYNWQASVGSNPPSSPSVSVMPQVSTSYTVTGTSAGCSDSAVVSVTVLAVANATVNNDLIFCTGSSVQLLAGGGSSYSWHPAVGLNNTSVSNPVASPTVTTTYTVLVNENACPPDSAMVTLTVNPIPVVTTTSASVCAGTNVILNASGANTYSWSNGFTTSSVSVTATTSCTYTVTGTSAGCSDTALSTVTVYPIPQVSFFPSQYEVSVIDEPEIHFFNTTSNGSSATYTWTFGDGKDSITSAPDLAHSYAEPGVYQVCLVAEVPSSGCWNSNCIEVTVLPDWTIYVPNAFTPGNNDKANDVFYAYGTNINKFQIWIFDRWGNLLFESENINKGWDGCVQDKGSLIVQEDVYVWKIKCTDVFNKKHQLSGTVSVIK